VLSGECDKFGKSAEYDISQYSGIKTVAVMHPVFAKRRSMQK
jgi:hypothetical protein